MGIPRTPRHTYVLVAVLLVGIGCAVHALLAMARAGSGAQEERSGGEAGNPDVA